MSFSIATVGGEGGTRPFVALNGSLTVAGREVLPDQAIIRAAASGLAMYVRIEPTAVHRPVVRGDKGR